MCHGHFVKRSFPQVVLTAKSAACHKSQNEMCTRRSNYGPRDTPHLFNPVAKGLSRALQCWSIGSLDQHPLIWDRLHQEQNMKVVRTVTYNSKYI
jgi:hypothetical protein